MIKDVALFLATLTGLGIVVVRILVLRLHRLAP
jgi:hypothetical protein